MDNFCTVCDEKFDSVVQAKEHFLGNRHKKKMGKSINSKRAIFVRGLPHGVVTDELVSYFSAFGRVSKAVIDQRRKTFGFVEFETVDDRDSSLQAVHYIKGRKLFVQAKEDRPDECQDVENSVSHDVITAMLQKCSSVEEQIVRFCSRMSLSQEDMDKRNSICSDIENALKEFYPECQIHMYGSSVNGCGSKGCDLDILFEPHPAYMDMDWGKQSKPGKELSVPSLYSIENGDVPLTELNNLPPASQVLMVSSILRRHRNIFRNVLFIPARCPIVKLIHKQTGQHCDISCSNRLVLCNTQLLRVFGLIDTRVVPLLKILRYWAKYRHIVRVGNITSYAFSLMVIFFLQNTSPPVLPSVQYLKYLSGDSRVEANWECGFCSNPRKVPASNNHDSIDVLLLQFFKFFSEFDFAYVISPLTGEPVHRSTFEATSGDEEYDVNDFQTTPMCVQDPFELNRNVTAFVKVKTLMVFRQCVMAGSSAFNPVPKPADSHNWGVLTLFSGRVQVDNHVFEVPSECALLSENKLVLTVSFSPKVQSVIKSDPDNFFGKICMLVVQMFSHGLLFEVEVLDQLELVRRTVKPSHAGEGSQNHSDPNPPAIDGRASNKSELGHTTKESSSEESVSVSWKLTEYGKKTLFSDDPERPVIVISVQNAVYHNTWTGRKRIHHTLTKDNLPSESISKFLDFENKVSCTLLDDKKKKFLVPNFFLCDCYTYTKGSSSRLLFVLTPEDGFVEFSSVAQFLHNFIISTLKDVL